ncbi:MAG: ADP/ATP-dependent (S)-NAD(P)H-hydrate dehydratase, partial [Fulvivirga sp.]|nr:ADP/ATP-dependent (S)-NAD(P)H-hydrate dehydratase [Fulvivirga sp.]
AHRELLEMLPAGSVITPHPKEFERLVGSWNNDFERLEKQKALAKEHELIVVVKGAHTAIASPQGEVYFNSTGNPGMATGGSGDVLTGIVASVLAQGYEPLHAAMIGIYVHGLAGDIARDLYGEIAMKASDIVDCLPQAFQNVSEV